MKNLGKGDGLLLVLCLLIILGGFLFFRQGGGQQKALQAEITVEGELYRRIELTGHKGKETIEINTSRGRNLILVEDEAICVLEADCPDKVCVKTGKLEQAGDTAACLPHKLLIEVKEGPLP